MNQEDVRKTPSVACPQCSGTTVLRTPCRSLVEQLVSPVLLPFRCQYCSHRFLAVRWGKAYVRDRMDCREFRRIPVRLALSFSGGRVQGEGAMIDLSVGGCAVQSPMPVKVNDIFYLKIFLTEQDPSLELAAIARSITARGIGFKFLRPLQKDHPLVEFFRTQGGGTPLLNP